MSIDTAESDLSTLGFTNVQKPLVGKTNVGTMEMFILHAMCRRKMLDPILAASISADVLFVTRWIYYRWEK